MSLSCKQGVLLLAGVVGGFGVGLLAGAAGERFWPAIVALLAGGAALLVTLGRRCVTEPMDALRRRVELMLRVGHPMEGRKLPTGRDDEIGRLARAIQELAATGYHHRKDAQRLRRTFDDRVALATRHATAELRKQAMRDPLTDLGNRRFMDAQAPRLFELAQERGEPIVVMAVDLDDFKRINDAYGHAVGDTVLRRLGWLLRACVRDGDLVVRLGGDEFVLWLPGVTMSRATELGDALVKLFGQQGGPCVEAGLSLGLASTQHDMVKSAAQLLALADRRLYEAKQRGKGRLVAAVDCA